MLSPRKFVRIAKWARHPPSLKMVILVFTLITAGLFIAGIEKFLGWPEALTANPRAHGKIKITGSTAP